jgi:ABC-2 type transport system permease protein
MVMRKVWVVAVREYLAAVKTKSFIIGLVLMPVLMSGGFLVQLLVGDQADLRPKYFAVIDRTAGQQFYPLLDAAAKLRNQQDANEDGSPKTMAAFHLEAVKPATEAELPELRYQLSERVKRGELTGFLEIGPEVMKPPPGGAKTLVAFAKVGSGDRKASVPAEAEPHALRYQTNRPSYQDFPKWAEAAVSAAVMGLRAEQRGIALTELATVVQPVPLVSKGLTTRDASGNIREAEDQSPVVAFLLPLGLILLMFMLILLGAAPLLQGVIEEKMQRIAEVLLGSIAPFGLMMGKIIGMVGVSLTMGSVYLAGAYYGLHHYGYADYLSPDIIAWFLFYQVLAVFMFGSLYAAVGAACTDMKEAQSMLMPITIIAMVPLFVWLNVVREPTSWFSTIISLVPTATPTLMLARQAVPPGIALWQPILGIAIMVATTLLCIYAAGRIFRVGILMQGKGARFNDLVRWVVRG